jgi:hypothetical protein
VGSNMRHSWAWPNEFTYSGHRSSAEKLREHNPLGFVRAWCASAAIVLHDHHIMALESSEEVAVTAPKL